MMLTRRFVLPDRTVERVRYEMEMEVGERSYEMTVGWNGW